MNLVGHPAPLFKAQAYLPNGTHGEVTLEENKGKWVLLFFYPLDFTFVCPTELIDLRDHLEEFQNRNTQILAASVDSVFSHEAWVKGDLGNLGFPLLSDIKKRMARDYCTLDESSGVSLRAAFFIDPEGTVQYALYHNLNVGRDSDELLRVLDALQTGELCGAQWKKGSKTLS